MRILHLVDLSEHASTPALACAAAVTRLPASHTIWTFGHTPLPPGFPAPSRRLPAPLHSPLLAWRQLQLALKRSRAPFDIVTCWSAGALMALHAACPRPGMPIVGVFATGPTPQRSRVAALLERRALDLATIVCYSDAAANAWRLAGAGDVRTAPLLFRFDTSAIPTRDAARATLGIEPDERVLALIADPPQLADARRFVYLAGLLSVGGAITVALVHTRNAQIRRAARYVRDCDRLWRLLRSDALTTILPACDAVLIDIRVLPTHPLATPSAAATPLPTAEALTAVLAAQLGIPVVLPRIPLADELLAFGVPVIRAADTSCLSLAAALFPPMDSRGVPSPAPFAPPATDSLDLLHELWLEKLNVPLPGFPLSTSSPLPPAITAHSFA